MEEYKWYEPTPEVATIEESPEQRQNRLQLNKDFHLVFSTESGKRVLDYFDKNTIGAPTWMPNVCDGYAQWREGQNHIIREIKYRLTQNEVEQ